MPEKNEQFETLYLQTVHFKFRFHLLFVFVSYPAMLDSSDCSSQDTVPKTVQT